MSSTDYSVPYILWWNDKAYEIDSTVFARFSKKFKRDLQNPDNQNQMDIIVNNSRGERVEEETFLAFVKACQLQPFDVTKKNVYELAFLASQNQWDVASLRTYIDEYIAKNKIDPPEVKDYLQILLDHLESNADTPEDWKNVADNINSALADERFEQVPPDVIYEILDIADRKSLSSDGLVAFVRKMLTINPQTAVPLLLRCDFDKFELQERAAIFQNPSVHTMNINFFTASAISALQNKNSITIAKRKRQQMLEFKCLEIALNKMVEEHTKEIKEQYNDEINEIKDEIYRQQAIIDKLTERINTHKQRILTAERKQASRRTPLDSKALQDLQNSVRRELQDMENSLDRSLFDHEKGMEKFVTDAETMAEKFFTQAAAESYNEVSKVTSKLSQLATDSKEIEQNSLAVKDLLGKVKSSLCAKVVRDKLRFDKFLRKTTNKFRIFEKEPRIFNLTSQDVKASEEALVQMDHHIEAYCPLRQQLPEPQPVRKHHKKQ
ncbi:hypothetical protein TVAG_384880 [Trichomonas vaginalis G3]|uniref:Uncharacterized protein n=1 Tax=Trichomonas vaginalis (strain ATCC PRA-98 / G3) TaxID=412133 RepID=A2G3J1_TRIV3|nr:hypothetical protein TVAGG3_0312950 [Trichomonas vaginalis G3]EAX88278.1 hypothetical protein TVAG_384880 [Trichomonas vaginalis G3]KAI5528749.1 hypothetical protein TVAGG3_0312950 [Trichomonas vaginalis G3]|eukprot:XP_001301208.1 hypothetical protein [Trichomonas vaginalis G3]